MKPIHLKEDEIADLVTIEEAIDVLEDAFLEQSSGGATSQPRERLRTDRVILHIMAGAIPGFFGYKAYTSGSG